MIVTSMPLLLETKKVKQSPLISFASLLIILACIALGVVTITSHRTINQLYDSLPELEQPLATYEFPDGSKLYLTDFRVLAPGEALGLISAQRPLPHSFKPNELTATELPHGDRATTMMLDADIDQPLSRLFNAADAAGYQLMISSAYRSISDQTKLLVDYKLKYGPSMAAKYVAQPGTSEHHSGLAVDLSDASEQCALDSDDCGLSISTAEWLHDNAYKYGFIQRYPEAKQSVTGVAYEPWHYRYVGVTPATYLHKTDLTLDEVIKQLQPGVLKDDS